jgi:hypothetical protein
LIIFAYKLPPRLIRAYFSFERADAEIRVFERADSAARHGAEAPPGCATLSPRHFADAFIVLKMPPMPLFHDAPLMLLPLTLMLRHFELFSPFRRVAH